MRVAVLICFAGLATVAGFGQSFDVASVKPSLRTVGKDAMTPIIISPNGLSARNVTLKRLIVQAYGVQPHQILGGPNWLDSSEYDVEAKAGAAVSRDEIRSMLRALLTERFRLAVHRRNQRNARAGSGRG